MERLSDQEAQVRLSCRTFNRSKTWQFLTRREGMAQHYAGPFYSYVEGYSPIEIREAMDDMADFIEDNGPFDGVIGFSQGASMAATFLLDHYTRFPDEAPPFDFAIFLSSVAAFSPDDTLCLPSVQRLIRLRQEYPSVTDLPDDIAKKLPATDSMFVEYLATTFRVAKKIGAVLPAVDIDFFNHEDPQKVPRVAHSSLTSARIKIPTIHFTGKTDLPAMVEQSRVVCGLCDQTVARVHQHARGHEAPSSKMDVQKLADAIEWAISESANQAALRTVLTRLPIRGVL